MIHYRNNVVDFINTFNNTSSRVKEQETLDSAGPNGRLSNAKLDLTGLWDWAIQEDPVLASPSAQSGEPDRLVFNHYQHSSYLLPTDRLNNSCSNYSCCLFPFYFRMSRANDEHFRATDLSRRPSSIPHHHDVVTTSTGGSNVSILAPTPRPRVQASNNRFSSRTTAPRAADAHSSTSRLSQSCSTPSTTSLDASDRPTRRQLAAAAPSSTSCCCFVNNIHQHP